MHAHELSQGRSSGARQLELHAYALRAVLGSGSGALAWATRAVVCALATPCMCAAELQRTRAGLKWPRRGSHFYDGKHARVDLSSPFAGWHLSLLCVPSVFALQSRSDFSTSESAHARCLLPFVRKSRVNSISVIHGREDGRTRARWHQHRGTPQAQRQLRTAPKDACNAHAEAAWFYRVTLVRIALAVLLWRAVRPLAGTAPQTHALKSGSRPARRCRAALSRAKAQIHSKCQLSTARATPRSCQAMPHAPQRHRSRGGTTTHHACARAPRP